MLSPEADNIAPNEKPKTCMYLIYLYSRHSFLHHTSQLRLVRSRMGWDHVSFEGCRSTVDRHIGRYVGRESTKYRPSTGSKPV